VKLPIALREGTNKANMIQDDIIWPGQASQFNIPCICPICSGRVFKRTGKHNDHFYHQSSNDCTSAPRHKTDGPTGGGEGVSHHLAKYMLVSKIHEMVVDTSCMCCATLIERRTFEDHTASEEYKIDSSSKHHRKIDVAVYDSSKQMTTAIEIYDSSRIDKDKQKDISKRFYTMLEVSANDVRAFYKDKDGDRIPVSNNLGNFCAPCTERRNGEVLAAQKKQLAQIERDHKRLEDAEALSQKKFKEAAERAAEREALRKICRTCDTVFYPSESWKLDCTRCYWAKRNALEHRQLEERARKRKKQEEDAEQAAKEAAKAACEADNEAARIEEEHARAMKQTAEEASRAADREAFEMAARRIAANKVYTEEASRIALEKAATRKAAEEAAVKTKKAQILQYEHSVLMKSGDMLQNMCTHVQQYLTSCTQDEDLPVFSSESTIGLVKRKYLLTVKGKQYRSRLQSENTRYTSQKCKAKEECETLLKYNERAVQEICKCMIDVILVLDKKIAFTENLINVSSAEATLLEFEQTETVLNRLLKEISAGVDVTCMCQETSAKLLKKCRISKEKELKKTLPTTDSNARPRLYEFFDDCDLIVRLKAIQSCEQCI
jgi:hypothetical protein